MALSAHLHELAEKHRQLDRRISEEMSRPGSDDVVIRRMKQQKLKIKEEINRLSSASRH
jgi:hypothetical protein